MSKFRNITNTSLLLQIIAFTAPSFSVILNSFKLTVMPTHRNPWKFLKDLSSIIWTISKHHKIQYKSHIKLSLHKQNQWRLTRGSSCYHVSFSQTIDIWVHTTPKHHPNMSTSDSNQVTIIHIIRSIRNVCSNKKKLQFVNYTLVSHNVNKKKTISNYQQKKTFFGQQANLTSHQTPSWKQWQ